MLVEADQAQVSLVMRALREHGIVAEADEMVARAGEEALDYLFGDGSIAGWDALTPEFILLDMKLLKREGLQVLKRLRDDERTKFVSVISSPRPRNTRSSSRATSSARTPLLPKALNFERFSEVMRYLGWSWLNTNERP
jgi:DNA-binding response OmpR family regulator